MKRVREIILVLLTAPLWLPLTLLIALAVRLAMGSPILFKQERAGRHGQPFTLLKFRTMRAGVEDDTVRLTSFGRWLRSTSMDELPQLLNVLRGDMALIGPRPLPMRYLPRYSARQRRRLDIPPGITGWAQVKGRNTLEWPRRFELDTWYVDNHGWALDLKIIALTILKIFQREGISQDGADTMTEFEGNL